MTKTQARNVKELLSILKSDMSTNGNIHFGELERSLTLIVENAYLEGMVDFNKSVKSLNITLNKARNGFKNT